MTLIDRGGVRDWLQTGMASLTIFANCSLGQRQLILGNDKVGKSTMLSNIAKNSSINSYYNLALSFNKFFFYNFIGSSKREFVYNKLLHSSLNKKFNFFVDSTISLNLYSQIRTPYYSVLNCLSLAHNGLNSVHILDSLSNHAKLYRTFMLDLKRSPGREAYPGDVFYLHSNLLEKYGQLNFFHNEGSVTGLPVSVIQNDDITDYITTNLISITDGQWFLSKNLKILNLYPCFDINLSVSRLGVKTQSRFLSFLVGKIKVVLGAFLLLEEQKNSAGLLSFQFSDYFKGVNTYSLLFFKEGLSYIKLVTLLLFYLLLDGFSYCNSIGHDTHYHAYFAYHNIKIFSPLLFWVYNTKSFLSSVLLLNYFYHLLGTSICSYE